MHPESKYLLEIKSKSKFSFGFKEILSYWELLYFFTWREIKVKYKQTVLGFLWVILQPALMTIVFTFFLGNAISSVSKLTVPYPLFALSGLVIWGFFSTGLSNAANSMVNNSNIIKKVYFPRLIIPFSAILSSSVDFLISLCLFFIALIYFQTPINWLHLLYLPLALIMISFSTLGIGMLLAALNIKYRDVRYILPFFIQGMLFVSPIMFPISITNNPVATTILQFNPVAGALELIRSVFLNYEMNLTTIAYSSISTLVFFMIGLYTFRKTEAYFADLA
ncbi:ABC transporter permease [Fluviicola sp.]|uniref:ABC transporter permease n=1 Tax=Fluviicola sp. TaxID=1917219 RepID=UPI003D2BFE04